MHFKNVQKFPFYINTVLILIINPITSENLYNENLFESDIKK